MSTNLTQVQGNAPLDVVLRATEGVALKHNKSALKSLKLLKCSDGKEMSKMIIMCV